MPTSLAPSPIARVMASFTCCLTSLTTWAFCSGETLTIKPEERFTSIVLVAFSLEVIISVFYVVLTYLYKLVVKVNLKKALTSTDLWSCAYRIVLTLHNTLLYSRYFNSIILSSTRKKDEQIKKLGKESSTMLSNLQQMTALQLSARSRKLNFSSSDSPCNRVYYKHNNVITWSVYETFYSNH